MEFLETTLDNGLEVIAESNPEARSLALGYFVKTGARDETADVAGVSHFLEHMVFKGTPRRSAEDVNREFDEMGAHYNAFTSEEKTVYYAAVLPEYQHQALDLLSDILRPSLREEDFDTEKKVILEEIQMYKDQPPFGADDRVRAMFYGAHPLGNSVLGTLDSVGNLSVDAMRGYFRNRYSPGNIVLVAAGKVDFDALVRQARECSAAWEATATERKVERAKPQPGFESLHRETASQQYLMQLNAAPSATDHDRFAAKLLCTVLGDDSGSRLFWELVDPGLAECASLSHYEYQGAGIFMTYLSCAPEETAPNIQRIRDIYVQAQEKGLLATELDQAKSKINSRVVLSSERPRGRLFNLGANWTHRREYRCVRDDLDAVDAVTLDQIRAVLAKYPLAVGTTITIGPSEQVSLPRD